MAGLPGDGGRKGGSGAVALFQLLVIAANGVALDIDPPAGVASKVDDHLWRILEAFPSAVLVTGDRRLIEAPAKGARVLTPRAFVEFLRG